MSLSSALLKALNEDSRDSADVVALVLGQSVEVRTKTGWFVANGDITELNHETGVVRVADRGSGSDLQIDVDTELYDVWVIGDDLSKDDPSLNPKTGRLSVHTKRAGAYAGGRF